MKHKNTQTHAECLSCDVSSVCSGCACDALFSVYVITTHQVLGLIDCLVYLLDLEVSRSFKAKYDGVSDCSKCVVDV